MLDPVTNEAPTSTIVDALGWVAGQIKSQHRPAVVNLSLVVTGDNASLCTYQDALTGLLRAGASVVVAAGNDQGDACRRTGATLPGVILVGGLSKTDDAWGSSDLGACVDVLAPAQGVYVVGDDGAASGQNGTSLAAPLVAGAVAQHLEAAPADSPEAAEGWLVAASTKMTLPCASFGAGSEAFKRCRQTPGRLLYTGDPDHTVPAPSPFKALSDWSQRTADANPCRLVPD